jgi:predicted dehydrogenase/threonine dehydrogenase-like Zn-dependent dehydrogenase
MKQIVQELDSGKTIIEDIPTPSIQPGHVLIRTRYSLVSLGTERMLVEFGKANYFQKARQQPEKVKQVIEKIKSDGLAPTLDAVFRKLNEPLPLGYSNAGEVIGVGAGVDQFKIGQRVISNGPHAEVVCIPENLVAEIPEGVSYEEACFTVVGAIGLQGIRLVQPTFGEKVVVIGLGLIGLITIQLLKANGCEVIGFDLEDDKIRMAHLLGIEAFNSREIDMASEVMQRTNRIGADAVIITASTQSSDVIAAAARMSRKKGRIVLVGVIGLDLKRSDFYEKELTFQVSCSYGPGRYDSNYEQKGLDYPIGYVRWTEKRNFQAVLTAIKNGQLRVSPLISEIKDLADYHQIYGHISNREIIASLLRYSTDSNPLPSVVQLKARVPGQAKGQIAIIGSGSFVASTILPQLKKCKTPVKYLVSSKGLSGTMLAKKYNIPFSATELEIVLQDNEVSLLIISTRHNLHADQVIRGLQSGKSVFVEKPLALTHAELENIIEAYRTHEGRLYVGFNRRYSPFALKARQYLGSDPGAINMVMTINAGSIPMSHWTQDMEIGGGRIVGEACHFIDLMTYVSGSLVQSVVMNGMGQDPSKNTDNASILLRFKNGSQGTIHYFSNGHKSYPKERMEIYASGKTMIIDNFRSIRFYGGNGQNYKSRQDKGHLEQFRLLCKGLSHDQWPAMTIEEIINTTRASLSCLDSIEKGTWIHVE